MILSPSSRFFGNRPRYLVEYPHAHILVLRSNNRVLLFGAILQFLVFSLAFGGMYFFAYQNLELKGLALLIPGLAAIFFTFASIREMVMASRKKVYKFDKNKNRFLLNNKHLSDISSIQQVQVRIIPDSDSLDQYEVSVIVSGITKPTVIDRHSQKILIYGIANELCRFLNKGLTEVKSE